MKRTIALLTAFILCVTVLAGCGGEKAEVSGQITPQNKPAESQAPAEVSGEITPQSEPAEDQNQTGEHELSLGRMEGGVYVNSYAGIGCELNSDWTFYSAEELQVLPENIREMLADSEFGQEMEGYTQITDMMAENVDLIGSVNVTYTKIGLKERLAYALLSEEDVIDMMLEQEDLLRETYAHMEINVEAMEKVEVSFLGETHIALHTTAETSGYPYYATQIFDYTRGQYGIVVTAASYIEDNTAELLEPFYKVD